MVPEKQLKRLVLDVENRPLSYWYDGAATAEITVVAVKWFGKGKVKSWALGYNCKNSREMLEEPLAMFAEADAVVAHNGSHDLGLLLATCVEYNWPLLEPKLLIDTYKGLARYKEIPKSLEYLADVMECPVKKPHLSQHKWRQANRLLDRDAIAVAVKRCEADVKATEWIYREQLRRGWLVREPRRWSP